MGLGVFTAGPRLTQSLVRELSLISLAVQKKKKEKQNSCRQFPCDSKSFLCEYDISLLVTTLKGAHMIHMAKK